MKIEPEERVIRWTEDTFANEVAVVSFSDTTELLRISVDLVIDKLPVIPFDFSLDQQVQTIPPAYEPLQIKTLAPYRHLDPAGPLLLHYLQTIDRSAMRTTDFLAALNRQVHEDIRYLVRREHGVQTPEQTLQKKSGSCRDSGWLLVQLLRHCGFAARFVSGYLLQAAANPQSSDKLSIHGAETNELHAWCEAYAPGVGWVGLDPTSGLLADTAHVPLACAPAPAAAAPVEGSVETCEVDFHYQISITEMNE